MASSSIPKFRPLMAPQGVHLLMAVGVPGVFCGLAVYWLTGTAPFGGEEVAGLVYAAALAFWASWRLRTHQGPWLSLWFWIILTGIHYGIVGLLGGRPWPAPFLFDGLSLFLWAAGFLQGILTGVWAGQLASRARLHQLLEGIPEGPALEERVRDFQLDADFSGANQSALAGSLVGMGASAVALASFFPRGGALTPLLLALFLGVCLITGVVLRLYRREMEALMYGRRLSWREKLGPVGWSLVLYVLACLGAWGLLLCGGPWLDWSSIDFGRASAPPEAQPPPASVPPSARDGSTGTPWLTVLLVLLAQIFRLGNIVAVLNVLIDAAWAALPWLGAAFLLWPLVRWFLNGGRETRGLLRRWRRLLVAQIRAFAGLLRLWWVGGGPVPGTVGLGAPGAREWLKSLVRGTRSGSRAPYPEVVRAFLAVVTWAEPLTPYRSGETTREFLNRLLVLIPSRRDVLGSIRDLLDQELFGPRGLDPEGRRRFLDLVGGLTGSPPSQEPPTGVS